MNNILLIALGISLAGNLLMANQLYTWKPKRDRNGRFVKKG